jgi:uncharacterized protein
MMRRILALLVLISVGALAQEIPAPQGYVSDYAEVLTPQTRDKLTALLQELEQKTTAQIAVLTVKTTQPYDDFEYALKVFDSWKIGQKGKDNGALFFVAVEDRRVRIVTGYGLEGILPDGRVGAILDEFVLPEFREGRFDEGISKGVWAVALIIAKDAGVELTGQAPVDIERVTNPSPIALVVALIILFLIVSLMIRYGARRERYSTTIPWWIWLAGSGGGRSWRGGSFGGFGGGFSRGGFGGFGGGRTGGGGAGRGW